MKLLEEYYKERMNAELIYTDYGFISYRMVHPFCQILELHITPSERKKGRASELADRVTRLAEMEECTHLWAQVQKEALNASESLEVILRYGFKYADSDNSRIILIKEIGGK
jgi:hypothetical protein